MAGHEDGGPLYPGQRIGDSWVVEGRLGSGGMSVVYRGRNERLREPVAIKVLRSDFRHDPHARARFLNEARATAHVKHDRVVKIYDFGTLADDTDYLVMEYLEGSPLDQWRRPGLGALTTSDLRLFRHVAQALAVVHDQRIVHRDVKPGNLIVLGEHEPDVKLVDFGIAKFEEVGDPTETEIQTQLGETMGTPRYRAPEQVGTASKATAQADVYALGVVMYEFFAGRPPFAGKDGELMMAHLHQAPPPLHRQAPRLPRRLVELIHHMLAKQPAVRPAMRQVEQALLQVEVRLVQPPRRRRAAALAVGLLGLAAFSYVFHAGPVRPVADLGPAMDMGADLGPSLPQDGGARARPDAVAPAVLAAVRLLTSTPRPAPAPRSRQELPARQKAKVERAITPPPGTGQESRVALESSVPADVYDKESGSLLGRSGPGRPLGIDAAKIHIVRMLAEGYIPKTFTIDLARGAVQRVALESATAATEDE